MYTDMAKAQEKQAFINNSSPIRENEEEGRDYEETIYDGGCGCFRLFCLFKQEGDHRETWLMKKMKKLKEVSEVVAGPKWKNFIRKLGKNGNNKKSRAQYQYDPQSYALNFDDGNEEDGLLLGFSSRFAQPPSSIEIQPASL